MEQTIACMRRGDIRYSAQDIPFYDARTVDTGQCIPSSFIDASFRSGLIRDSSNHVCAAFFVFRLSVTTLSALSMHTDAS